MFHCSQALTVIIKPWVQDPQGFLQQHIQRDLEQLTKMLGRSADETIHVVHLILSSLLRVQSHGKHRGKSCARPRTPAGVRATDVRRACNLALWKMRHE